MSPSGTRGRGRAGTGGRVRARVRVEGIVQGVGFRPFVHSLATGLGLAGTVGNDSQGVLIEVEGVEGALARFLVALERDAPPLALVEQVGVEALAPVGERGFVITRSATEGQRHALVSPDVATCDACLAEILDPGDRRFRYPFTNCTNCGPRYTIVVDVPYDRSRTTMAGFAMCPDCSREYHDPEDRRFHAQPVCCPDCGPRLSLVDAAGNALGAPVRDRPGEPGSVGAGSVGAGSVGAGGAWSGADAIVATAGLLDAGQVVAIKGLGGYHLAALASDEAAVASLRARKHREDKPFAVMAPDLERARRLGRVGAEEERLLTGWRRPIVLLDRWPAEQEPVAPSVAPGNHSLGVMLPYTPLHHLLAAELDRPFVLTSGNLSDEPIAYRDEDALCRLRAVADAFLVHDRPIHMRVDDSVVRVVDGQEMPLRRSRGYAPMPVHLGHLARGSAPLDGEVATPLPLGGGGMSSSPVTLGGGGMAVPVLGCGAELKVTFCLARGQHAFLSHHIGDLESWETLRSYREGIAHFQRLFDVRPAILAHDLHPEYLSTKWALEQAEAHPELALDGVQHHHAHLASCLADNGVGGPVVGVVFDGLGYGLDGTLWGGEVLVADLVDFERAAHLQPVAMPGGKAAIVEVWRMAASYLDVAFGDDLPAGLEIHRHHADHWEAVVDLARRRLSAPVTSSVGRLFDAAAAICGLRDRVNYEGQAAIELEQLVDRTETGGYPMAAVTGQPTQLIGSDLVRALAEDVAAGVDVGTVAGRFHNGLAAAVVHVAADLAQSRDLGTVALSGGVFQNVILLQRVTAGLRDRGLRVLVHSRVPPNDGGISLGQVAVARARSHRQC